MIATCFGGAALAQLPASAPAGAPPAAESAVRTSQDTASGGYVLGRDDVIEVSLLGRQEWGGRVRVQTDGTVQLALIGKLQAAEHTTSELSETIRKALQTGGFYADPIVNVEVVSFASRYITVLGAFGNPGLIPMNRPYRLSEILARVGGVREGGADYIIVRSANGAEKHYPIRDIATGDATQDPYVQSGDKLYAPIAEVFYVYGQVHTPGVFPVVNDMTLRMAIARAGGVTDQGSDKRAQVTRGGKTITVDSAGKILPGDVVFIKERLF
jgi:polysaccharide export outer membrane protein